MNTEDEVKEWHEEQLEEQLEEVRLRRLPVLVLVQLELDRVPEEVRELTWLERIDLSANEIRVLPAWLTKLENLREVRATRNPVDSVPQGLPVSLDWSTIDRLGVEETQIVGVSLDWRLHSVPDRFPSLRWFPPCCFHQQPLPRCTPMQCPASDRQAR